MKKRILSISYDESIMKTRHYIFAQAGFDVVSALGFSDALAQCQDGKFDVVVLGHTLPPQDKTALVSALREKCQCPIVSIRKPGQGRHPQTLSEIPVHRGSDSQTRMYPAKVVMKRSVAADFHPIFRPSLCASCVSSTPRGRSLICACRREIGWNK